MLHLLCNATLNPADTVLSSLRSPYRAVPPATEAFVDALVEKWSTRLEDNPDKGRKVWLTETEVNRLMTAVDDTERHITLRLMADSGLRTKEVLRARPADVRPMDGEQDGAGHKFRVWEGKGDQYRET